MNYAGLPRILFNGDHPYNRINDYTDITRAVIVAMIRKCEDAVGDAKCGFPINANYTLLHLTGNYKQRRRRRGRF